MLASLAWELAKQAFAWYLSSGFAKYDLVYGSLGAVVALMFWIYIGSWIVFFGAHLSAVIAGRS
jgi:membrane protein